jgi:hypothetical protein
MSDDRMKVGANTAVLRGMGNFEKASRGGQSMKRAILPCRSPERCNDVQYPGEKVS